MKKMKKGREITFTKEDVRKFRRDLEKETEKSLKKSAEMRRKSWVQIKSVVLD